MELKEVTSGNICEGFYENPELEIVYDDYEPILSAYDVVEHILVSYEREEDKYWMCKMNFTTGKHSDYYAVYDYKRGVWEENPDDDLVLSMKRVYPKTKEVTVYMDTPGEPNENS